MATITLDDVITSEFKVSERGFKEKEKAKKGSGVSVKLTVAYDLDGITAEDMKEVFLRAMDVAIAEPIRGGEYGELASLDGGDIECNVHEFLNRDRKSTAEVRKATEERIRNDERKAMITRLRASGFTEAQIEAIMTGKVAV